mmetsp:Transcript_27375/g.69647  ORF Transcript_27375/g.69647 Transcript_27375/m.69647 type:complete len:274 (+) Transcript_27375:270-1091(+)
MVCVCPAGVSGCGGKLPGHKSLPVHQHHQRHTVGLLHHPSCHGAELGGVQGALPRRTPRGRGAVRRRPGGAGAHRRQLHHGRQQPGAGRRAGHLRRVRVRGVQRGAGASAGGHEPLGAACVCGQLWCGHCGGAGACAGAGCLAVGAVGARHLGRPGRLCAVVVHLLAAAAQRAHVGRLHRAQPVAAHQRPVGGWGKGCVLWRVWRHRRLLCACHGVRGHRHHRLHVCRQHAPVPGCGYQGRQHRHARHQHGLRLLASSCRGWQRCMPPAKGKL